MKVIKGKGAYLRSIRRRKIVVQEHVLYVMKHASIKPPDCIFGTDFHTKVSVGDSWILGKTRLAVEINVANEYMLLAIFLTDGRHHHIRPPQERLHLLCQWNVLIDKKNPLSVSGRTVHLGKYHQLCLTVVYNNCLKKFFASFQISHHGSKMRPHGSESPVAGIGHPGLYPGSRMKFRHCRIKSYNFAVIVLRFYRNVSRLVMESRALDRTYRKCSGIKIMLAGDGALP